MTLESDFSFMNESDQVIKKRYQITYSLLDKMEVGNQSFYVKEEALAAIKNLGYADERDVIFLLDLQTLKVEYWKCP